MNGSPQPPDIRRRALSTRGYLAVAAVPPLLAAIAFGTLWATHHDEVVLPGQPVPLLTSSWKPGNASDGALIGGVLQLGQDGCVHLTQPDGSQLTPVWPAEYTARRSADGSLTLYDPHDGAIAHDGDQLRMGGGFSSPEPYRGQQCAPASGQVALVESTVTVVSP
ncbi:MAG: hypothetical protein JWO11_1998 [Nocardioides sp.]|nr:hypothetical protein [Nocardioides sp.]